MSRPEDSVAPALAAELGDDQVEQPRRRRERTRHSGGMGPRARTLAIKQLSPLVKRAAAEAAELPPVEAYGPRPRTWGECLLAAAGPCPWLSCKHHLYLDVHPETGALKINFPDREPWELDETCALEVAERGETTLEDVGTIMNITRERVRQVEVVALLKLKRTSPTPDELGADLEAKPEAAPLSAAKARPRRRRRRRDGDPIRWQVCSACHKPGHNRKGCLEADDT